MCEQSRCECELLSFVERVSLCELCCHDVKWSEEVYMCASRASVRKSWRTRVRGEMGY